MAEKNTQLAVIGGGPGGYAAAFMAADLGLDVTLIDPDNNPGGVCLYRGCIPSKALLHVAKLIYETRESKAWGVSFTKPKINLDKLRGWKDDVVDQLTGGLGQLTKQRKIQHIQGTARFDSNKRLFYKESGGAEGYLNFEYAVIATGSLPVVIPKFDLGDDRILDSTTALELQDIPDSLLVVGGGYIGLELGTVYASLGSKVTVIEMTEGLLPGADRDLVRVLHKSIEPKLEKILLKTTVKEMKAQKNGIKVSFESDDDSPRTKIFDKVLMSVGRRPTTDGLDLDNTNIETDKRGFIKVDEQRRTSEKNILAIGDVAGEPMLAHKASHEGRVAAEVIAGKNVAYNPAAIPAVVFTDPELAWAGYTEAEAKEAGLNFEVSKFPWAASGRAATLGRSDGLTKLIVDKDTEQILGIGIVGPGAGEMIAEGVLAVEMGANVTDLGLSIHPHPTLTETLMEAADLIHGTATHFHRPKRKKK